MLGIAASGLSRKMRWLKYVLAGLTALIFLAVALFVYSFERDQANFKAAKNQCEAGCIQDSGGIDQCRVYCKDHPGRYP
jgi:hypothetical protein